MKIYYCGGGGEINTVIKTPKQSSDKKILKIKKNNIICFL